MNNVASANEPYCDDQRTMRAFSSQQRTPVIAPIIHSITIRYTHSSIPSESSHHSWLSRLEKRLVRIASAFFHLTQISDVSPANFSRKWEGKSMDK